MKTRGSVLIVDDEPYVRDSLVSVLQRDGYHVRTAGRPQEAFRGGRLDGIDAVITDLKMPGEDGLSLLRRMGENAPGIPVIVLTGYGTIPSAVECMRAGAFDYLMKPASTEALLLILERAINNSTMRRELEYLRSDVGTQPVRRSPIGESTAWKQVMEIVEAAAPADTTVLLVGESGTGKEEVAHLLHRKSRRAAGPFVKVNCAAIPMDLFESEFFGHRKGSFTGALADRDGRFRVAHRGTLFMDEVSAMPEEAQIKVLRVLQDGVFERVGDSHSTSVDVRLITASNADLEKEVEGDRFRRDLFYRLNVMAIHLPPLRDRLEDVPLMADAFLVEFAGRLGRPVDSIAPETLALLQAYHWPGNVRELRNIVERAILLEKSHTLQPASLPFNLRQREKPADGVRDLTLRNVLAAEERNTLEEALRRTGGVRRDAARLLGIDERNLNYFLKKHGLNKGKVSD